MPKALVIDDEVWLTDLVGRFLDRAGFEVETAASGQEGLQKAIASPPDAIVLDVMMPDVDGYEVCRRLRNDPRTARAVIVILTARGQLIDKEVALRAGADAYLAKPYQGSLLVEEIQRLLAGRPEATPPLGYQIVVLRLAPGSGATTLVTNLGVAMAQDKQRLVAIADMDLEAGQVGKRLALPPIGSWPEEPGEEEDLPEGLVRHKSGAFVLPAPPPGRSLPGLARVQATLGHLRHLHDYVVVDTPYNMGPLASVLLALSPLVFVVLRPNQPELRAAQASLAAIKKLGSRVGQIWPVLNMVRPGQEAFYKQVEAALHQRVAAILPWAPEVCAEAASHGMPVVLDHPESPLARAFGELDRWVVRTLNEQSLRRIPR
jgi:DNA-binding response OmpR family regulator